MEHSPYCERDIKRPTDLETIDQKGDFKILIKKQGLIYPYIMVPILLILLAGMASITHGHFRYMILNR
jgi:hypothetical protein